MGWLLGLLSMAASGFSVAALLHGDVPLAAMAHLTGVLLGARGSTALRGRSGRSGRFEYYVGLALPCVGGSAVWLHAAAESEAGSGEVAREFSEYIDPVARLGEARLPDVKRNPGPDPDSLEPLVSVLESDASADEKRRAVARLARLETPQAVQALRGALQDECREVRFLAANAISSLEQRLGERLSTPRAESGEPGRMTPQDALEVARAYFDYAYYGLADDLDRPAYLRRAEEQAAEAWEGSHDPDALLLRGRILLEMDRSEAAVEMFERYVTCEPDDPRGYLWEAEAHFTHGDYRAVRRNCLRARQCGGVPEVTRGAVEMWTAGSSHSGREASRSTRDVD